MVRSTCTPDAWREATRGCFATARHRTTDQFRDNLLRPSPPGGATRRAAAGVSQSTSTFQGTWAQPQLASQAAVHAAEVGHPVVHTGLSGVSAAFDARGQQLAWYAATERGAIVVDVPLGSHTTAFQRLGNWVSGLASSILAGAGVVATMRSRR